ncbi:MAG: ATP-binding protein [Acidobacteriota bacterium]
MFNRISFRLGMPIALGVLLAWGFLTFFVLSSISRFAAERSERDLKSYGREVADILGDSYDHLVLSGKMSDSTEVRVSKARALGRLEKHFRLTETPGLVVATDGSVLLSCGLESPAALLALPVVPQKAVKAVTADGEERYTYQIEFPLWEWRVILTENAADYAQLTGRVRSLYLGSGGLLLLALCAFLLFVQRAISRPVAVIAKALERGERPGMLGVDEFNSLAVSIRAMMDECDERERQVRVGRLWYRQIFESAPVMMFSLAPNGWFSDVNRRLCDLTGLTREKLLSIPASEVLQIDPERLEEIWMGTARQQVSGLLRTERGLTRQVLLDALLTEDPSGQRVVLAVVIDVTEQRRSERELIEAKENAEQANRAKSEFLANVSHEIRTPLNGVLGMLQLLEKSSLDERQKSWTKNALDCGRSLLTLLGDILDFSTLESGSHQCGLEPFAPTDILLEISQLFSRQAQAKSVAISIESDPTLPRTLMGDGGRLRQALFNLVGNAVKFTEHGFVTIRVEAVDRDRHGVTRLLFTVEDSGIGIDRDKLRRIFDPFTQADGSHTRRYQGAGLGLAIVKRLVELWGGSLDVDSAPGEGTLMAFTMPVHAAPAGTQAPLAVAALPGSPGTGPGTGGRVLLAEDDPINTVMTMDMLESLGYRATIVENGADALRALAQEEFDCLLMDIQMPEMDGITATRAIRSAPALGEKTSIPIIALTAHALPGDRERFLAAGMDDYLAKPVEYDDLAGVLARAMGKPWRRRLS